MRFNEKPLMCITSFLLLFACGIIAASSFAFERQGADNGSETPAFSLDERCKTLQEALKRISKATGYEITVYPEGADLPVMMKLKNVTAYEGLKRILRRLNHAIVINDTEKKISLLIYDVSTLGRSSQKKPAMVIFYKQLMKNKGAEALLEREENVSMESQVIPPGKHGEPGITRRELGVIWSRREKTNPQDLEVIPSKDPGKIGVTQRDIESIKAIPKGIEPKHREIFPPKNS
jgi:hypothetical protein